MRWAVAHPPRFRVSFRMPHAVAAIAVVVIVHVVPAAEEGEVPEVCSSPVRPCLQVVNIAVLPRPVAVWVGAHDFIGGERQLLPQRSGALGAPELEREALVIDGAEKVVLRSAQAEKIERR